ITEYLVYSTQHPTAFRVSSSPAELEGLMPGSHQFYVAAINSAGEGDASAFSDPITIAAPQTITFPSFAAWSFGTPLQLSAGASSGLALADASTTPEVCTVSGNDVDFVAAGTCTIVATQEGNAEWLPVQD